jgi:hypothetical protein
LCSIDDLIEWEGVDVTGILRLMANIYDEGVEHIVKERMSSLNPSEEAINEVIVYNLAHVKYLSLNSYIALKGQEKMNNLHIYRLLDKVCDSKINILPFLEEVFPQKILDELNKIHFNLFENITYFTKLSDNQKFIAAEVYKHINLNNFINFRKIFEILNIKLSIELILSIKLSTEFTNIACVTNNSKIEKVILTLGRLNLSENWRSLFDHFFSLPAITFIFESHMNIYMLETNYAYAIRDYMTNKLLLIEQALHISKLYSPIIQNKLKVIKIKHHCIHNSGNHDIVQLYNQIRGFLDYSQFVTFYKRDSQMLKEIEILYTN